MSELIAEARVLVTPDTTAFRAQLVSQLSTATKGVSVPIPVTPVVSSTQTATAGLIAAQQQLATQAALTGDALRREQQLLAQGGVLLDRVAFGENKVAEATRGANEARRASAAAAAVQARQLGQLERGAAATALSFTGLRGATLAATGPFLAGAASVALFAKAVSASAQLETSLNTFQVTAGATADQMARIGDEARQLGTDLSLPGVTAQSAADALAQLSRAGLSVEDSIAGARGTLQLATAAGIDNAEAVTLVANALNAFSLAGKDATRVADLLAAASKESQGDIVDVGLAFQQSAAAAAQAGLSVEDTIALLTELGRAGLRGSDAGTSLRVALIRLIAPTNKAKEALDGLHVAIRDVNGNVRPEAFTDIAEQLQKMTKAQQDATLALIFGQDAFRAASILGRAGAVGFRETAQAVQEQGAAAELASAKTKGLAGAFENLSNQGSGLALSLGDLARGPLTLVVNTAASIAGNFNTGLTAITGFFGGLGDETDIATAHFDDLVAAYQKLRPTESAEQVKQQVEDMGVEAARASLAYQQLLQDIANAQDDVNKFLESGGDTSNAPNLTNEVDKLTGKLEDQEPAALKARDAIEGYRAGLDAAAGAAAGLTARLDESFDRMAHAPQQPVVPTATGPKAIGPDAKQDAAEAKAQAQGDLQEVLRIQQIRLDAARKAFENSKGNVKQRTDLFKKMAAAEAAVIATRRQIATQQQNAARQAQTEAEQQAAAADKAVLDRQAFARQQQANVIARAAQTTGLQDDIDANKKQRALINQQIQNVKDRVKDEKTRQTAVQALVTARDATTGEIKRLTQTQQEQNAAAQEAFAQSVFERTGNVDPLLAVLDEKIRDAIAARNKAKKGSAEWKTAQAAINDLIVERRTTREQVQDDAIQTRIAFGQSVLDLTGNKNVLLKAIDAGIKEATEDRNQAKKGTKAWLQAQTAINGFLKQRKDLLEAADDASKDAVGGTSLVDLFNKARDIVAGSGNVGQTASSLRGLSAIPRIQSEVQQRLNIVNDPAAAAAAKQVAATDRLVLAIDQLTQVLTGNTASGTPITRREQNQWRDLTQAQRFYNQRTARQMVEQGLVG